MEYKGNGQTFYKREEYYNDNNIILVRQTKDEIDEKFQKRIEFSLYQRGNDYFKEFLKDK